MCWDNDIDWDDFEEFEDIEDDVDDFEDNEPLVEDTLDPPAPPDVVA